MYFSCALTLWGEGEVFYTIVGAIPGWWRRGPSAGSPRDPTQGSPRTRLLAQRLSSTGAFINVFLLTGKLSVLELGPLLSEPQGSARVPAFVCNQENVFPGHDAKVGA